MIAVGADNEGGAGKHCGTVYVFRFNGTRWLEEQQLAAADSAAFDHFGVSAAVHGTLVLVGADGDDRIAREDAGRLHQPSDRRGADTTGAAYLYRFAGPGCGWVEDVKKTASDGQSLDRLGFAVALSAHYAFAGLFFGNDPACVFDTAELSLDIDPTIASPGQAITVVTGCGAPRQPVGLVLTSVNGVPMFAPLLNAEFAHDSQWRLATTVPPGLSGTTATFQTFEASDPCRGRGLGSNEVTVVFQ